MNNLKSSTLKYLGLIIFVCVVFMIIVGQAYNYIPVEEKNIIQTQQNPSPTIIKYEPEYKTESVTQNNEQEEITNNNETFFKRQENSITKQKFTIIPELEPLEPINKTLKKEENTNATTFESKLKTAKQFRKNREFEKAIIEFQTALELIENEDEKALCYEEIANTFAITKRYGSAITYAQKAYRIKPSSSLEFLLARLYYKTGNIDKATNRIDFILKKDFNVED